MEKETSQEGVNRPAQGGADGPAQQSAEAPEAAAPQAAYVVPERQWGLPVGFCGGCRKPVTLRELVEGSPPLLPAESLTDEQRTQLVMSRISQQAKFSLSVYGVGVIDKERAVGEVRQGSKVGKAIARVEMMMVEEMIALATGKEAPANVSPAAGKEAASNS